jgi:hypothetical protein
MRLAIRLVVAVEEYQALPTIPVRCPRKMSTATSAGVERTLREELAISTFAIGGSPVARKPEIPLAPHQKFRDMP